METEPDYGAGLIKGFRNGAIFTLGCTFVVTTISMQNSARRYNTHQDQIIAYRGWTDNTPIEHNIEPSTIEVLARDLDQRDKKGFKELYLYQNGIPKYQLRQNKDTLVLVPIQYQPSQVNVETTNTR